MNLSRAIEIIEDELVTLNNSSLKDITQSWGIDGDALILNLGDSKKVSVAARSDTPQNSYDSGLVHIVIIFKVTDGDDEIYLRLMGEYNSWDGNTWDDNFEVVAPKEQTVVVYESLE